MAQDNQQARFERIRVTDSDMIDATDERGYRRRTSHFDFMIFADMVKQS